MFPPFGPVVCTLHHPKEVDSLPWVQSHEILLMATRNPAVDLTQLEVGMPYAAKNATYFTKVSETSQVVGNGISEASIVSWTFAIRMFQQIQHHPQPPKRWEAISLLGNRSI